jgi:hypothetical protein
MTTDNNASANGTSWTKAQINMLRREANPWLILGMLIFIAGALVEFYVLLGPIMDLNSKAAWGDAINGLTAPLIGIIGAVLIYISFKEQVRTNKFHFQALQEQREWDLLYRLYEELKSDLKSIQPYYGSRYNETDILTTFMNHVLSDTLSSSPYPDLSKYLDYIFKQFSFLSMRISMNDVLGNTEKVYMIEKARQLFNLYFESHYSRIVDNEWNSRFSVSFQQNLEYGGKAIINLNMLSIDILKEKYQAQQKKN